MLDTTQADTFPITITQHQVDAAYSRYEGAQRVVQALLDTLGAIRYNDNDRHGLQRGLDIAIRERERAYMDWRRLSSRRIDETLFRLSMQSASYVSRPRR